MKKNSVYFAPIQEAIKEVNEWGTNPYNIQPKWQLIHDFINNTPFYMHIPIGLRIFDAYLYLCQFGCQLIARYVDTNDEDIYLKWQGTQAVRVNATGDNPIYNYGNRGEFNWAINERVGGCTNLIYITIFCNNDFEESWERMARIYPNNIDLLYNTILYLNGEQTGLQSILDTVKPHRFWL